MEFSNLLAPLPIEVYNLLEVNLLLHKYLPKVLLRQKPRDRTDHNPVFYNNAIITDITYIQGYGQTDAMKRFFIQNCSHIYPNWL